MLSFCWSGSRDDLKFWNTTIHLSLSLPTSAPICGECHHLEYTEEEGQTERCNNASCLKHVPIFPLVRSILCSLTFLLVFKDLQIGFRPALQNGVVLEEGNKHLNQIFICGPFLSLGFLMHSALFYVYFKDGCRCFLC